MSTPHIGYDKLCDTIYQNIFDKLERPNDIGKRFAIKGTAKDVLDSYTLRQFFLALATAAAAANHSEKPHFKIDEAFFSESIKRKDLYDFLAVLIFASCKVEAAWNFTKHLVEPEDGSSAFLQRQDLPVDKQYLGKIFGDRSPAIDQFYNAQACFATFVIKKGQDNVVKDPAVQRLPWLEEEDLGEGNFGKVRKVKIAVGHFQPWDDAEPAIVARKDYLLNINPQVKDDFRREGETMKKIFLRSIHDNVLASLGTLKVEDKPPTFSLFMPQAEEDLQHFMERTQRHQERGLETSARARTIRSAMGLAAGLRFLHDGMNHDGEDHLICYHMDLKPNNVLVFRDVRQERSDPHEDDRIWKLSDFGMSKVRIINKRPDSNENEAELDFARFFKNREAARDTSEGGTTALKRASTYAPVESQTGNSKLNEKADIWSLGCILSVIFTFMEEGWDGVENFSKERLRENREVDAFYEFPQWKRTHVINSAVKSQHKKLLEKAGERRADEMEALKIMLRFLEDKLLVHASSRARAGRCRATDIVDALGNTLTRYRRLAESPPAPNNNKDKRKMWYRFRPSRQDSTDSRNVEKIQRWRLSPDIRANFKGCESSPDGTVLAFWNETMIMLFKTSSSREGQASAESDTRSCLKPVGERRSENTEFWKDVKLTSRYLVAATSSGKFRCYIFDIEMAEDLTKYSIVALQIPEIHMLAIATHEQSLACVLVNDSDFTSKTLLFTARILLRDQDFKSNILTIETPREGMDFPDQEIYLGDQITVPLEWSPKNIILLLSKTQEEGYIVARPSNKGANVTIHRYYVDSMRTAMEELIVDSSSIDNAPARHFTALACYYQNPLAIAVFQTDHIYKIKFSDAWPGTEPGSLPTYIKKDLESHRVLKVKMHVKRDTIYALGTPTPRRNVYLLKIWFYGSGDRLKVDEIAELPGLADSNDMNLEICDDGREGFALVTTVVPSSPYAVYSIRLPKT